MTAGMGGGRDVRAVAGIGLCLLGAGLALVGVGSRSIRSLREGPNAAIDAGASDKTDLSANNSPTLVRNPTNLANLALSNRIDDPAYSCALRVSVDSGATWAVTTVPFPVGEELPPRCFAPDVAFTADGRLYVVFATLVGLGNTPHAIWLSESTDGGRILSSPRRVLGPLAFQVRLAVDPERAGVLFLTWLQATSVATLGFRAPGNPIDFVRSDDGGVTWSPPGAVNAPSRTMVVAPSPAVGPDGSLLCAYLDLEGDSLDYLGAHQGQGGPPYAGTWQLIVARSTDGGRSWRDTVVDADLVPTQRIVVYLPEFPSVAVDRARGRVYVAYQSAFLGDSDVYLWTSHDSGARFGSRVRVNDTPPHDGTDQYLPALAVAPDGRLDVLYYDRRDDKANLANEVSLQWSTDGGRTFSRRVKVSDRSFDSRIGFGSVRGLADLGSQLALVSTNDAALAVWTDTRAGHVATASVGPIDKQDLAREFVTFRPASPAWPLRRITGIALVGLGALLVLSVVVARLTKPHTRDAQSSAPAEPPVSTGVEA